MQRTDLFVHLPVVFADVDITHPRITTEGETFYIIFWGIGEIQNQAWIAVFGERFRLPNIWSKRRRLVRWDWRTFVARSIPSIQYSIQSGYASRK